MLQVGLAIPNTHETLAEPEILVKAARLAEARGFASVWVNDHLVVPTVPKATEAGDRQAQYLDRRRQKIQETLMLLAYLAAETKRVRLGTSVFALALRNPIVAAKQIATLDQLSGGRVTVGVGVGWMEGEFAALGVPFTEREARTDEALRILKTLWSSERPEFHGTYHSFRDIAFHPRPIQQPHPPLWIRWTNEGGSSTCGENRECLASIPLHSAGDRGMDADTP